MKQNTVPEKKSWRDLYFSKQDLLRIEAAVAKAEAQTSAEIVPVIARQSSTTGHVFPMIFLMLGILLFTLPKSYWAVLGGWNEGLKLLLIYGAEFVLVALSAALLARAAWVRRFFTSELDRNLQVDWRAEIEFLTRIVHRTEGHTGVLLYVSLMEHRAVILAEKSVKSQFPEEVWAECLKELLQNIKNQGLAPALEKTIDHIGILLASKLPVSATDRNEVPNELIWLDS